MESDSLIRNELLALLRGGNAHMPFNEAVANFPDEAMNVRPPNVPYTPWQLLDHMRRTQNDILEFIRDPEYQSPPWPIGFWPKTGEQADRAKWEATIAAINKDLADLEAIVKDPKTDLAAPIPHAPTYTIFREILLVGDHNAYHTGEFAILRQVMDTWPEWRSP